MKNKLKNKTIFITGASRGIGQAMALEFARRGANIAVASKSVDSHPKLAGTLKETAALVEKIGTKCLVLELDVRSEEGITKCIDQTFNHFGRLDAVIHNAGAIWLAPTEQTPAKRWDLMHQVNSRACFLLAQASVKYLRKSDNPHFLSLSPPISMQMRWLAPHVAYTISKYGMSMCILGMSEEFKEDGIAFNALWPKRIIQTAATQMLFQQEKIPSSRKAEIMALCAGEILETSSRELTGQLLIDEDFLKTRGWKDFSAFNQDPSVEPTYDLYIDDAPQDFMQTNS